MQPCVGWLLHLHRTRRKDSSSRSVSAIRGRSCSSPFTKTGIGLHRPPQVTTSIAPSGRTCAGRKTFLEPDYGHSHCSSRHRRSCRCGDHSCFRAHLQDAAQLAVRALSSRNQQSPDAIMNGAVLDPDKVCPTCQSSAFELPSGSRPQAPVLCGGCQASLGSWSAFRRRVGRMLLLRPASRSCRAASVALR
jgi:hypothetical protein